MNAPVIVAEACGNHRGKVATAKRMIEVLARYCCDMFADGQHEPIPAIKFQKRTCTLDLYPDWDRPHPEPYHAYGDTYLEHRRALEFSPADLATLAFWAKTCSPRGVHYACSVWDIPAIYDVLPTDPAWIKVPSARNFDFDLLDELFAAWAGEVHISLGMITHAEQGVLVSYLKAKGVCDRVVLYACTSGYPVPADQVHLGELDALRARWGGLFLFGFSGHHNGIALDMGAVVKGAAYIERHFTLDRTWRGTDQAASLEPMGMRALMRNSAAMAAALTTKPSGGMAQIEHAQRAKLKDERPVRI